MIDCIAGYHLNPWTCGIAKFNAVLARQLSLRGSGNRREELQGYGRPLLSWPAIWTSTAVNCPRP